MTKTKDIIDLSDCLRGRSVFLPNDSDEFGLVVAGGKGPNLQAASGWVEVRRQRWLQRQGTGALPQRKSHFRGGGQA